LTEEFEEVKQRSLWIDALERLVRNKTAVFGLMVALIVIFLAIFGPYITPRDYLRIDIDRISEPPSRDYWLGSDQVGRDILSRLMHSARTAVFVAIVVLSISTVIGVALGAIAAYARGWIDDGIMRLTDVVFSFPDLLLAAFLSVTVRTPVVKWVATLQTRTQWGFLDETIYLDYLIMFGALSLVGWAGYCRLIRGQILSLRERDFIRAVVALGVPNREVIRKHLVPNAMAPIMVSLTLSVGGVMLSEASLSFLGLGIQPPGASWGNMINEGRRVWRTAPHLVAMPGITLAIVVFGFNFLGDGINDAMNPRQIRR
jgi:peptide/nickel transport system permease protein